MFDYLAFIHAGIEVGSPGRAHDDGETLATQCVDQLRQLDAERFPPKLLILLASPVYLESEVPQKLLEGVHQGFANAGLPFVKLIGCSVAAVFFNRKVHPKGALLVCLASRLLNVDVATASVSNSTPQEAARTVLQKLSLDIDAGDDLNPFANRTLFTFLPGFRPTGYIAANLHDSLRQRLWARVPIIGGVSSGYNDDHFSAGVQFADREVNKNLIVAASVTSRTLWGMSVGDNLKPTHDLLRVDELGTDERYVKMFDTKPAPDVIKGLEDNYKFIALGKRSFNGEPVIERPQITGDQVRLLREISVGDSFRVLRADRADLSHGVTRAIMRSVKSIGLHNPIGCLGFKCSGYFASHQNFGFDLSEEIVKVEELLGLNNGFVGGFVDGEAGRDLHGRSQIRSWSTAAIVFGDELRYRNTFQEAFDQLAAFLHRYPSHDETLDSSVEALVRMIYAIGFPGVQLSLKVDDNLGRSLIVPNGFYTAGSLAFDDAGKFPIVIRLGPDEDPSTEPAAKVERIGKAEFFSYEETGKSSYYLVPLRNIDRQKMGVLQIDLGSVKSLRSFERDLLRRLGIIAGASLARIFNFLETTIRRKLQDAFNRGLAAAETWEGVEQYLGEALTALGLRMGHIRMAVEFELQLFAGVGKYYEAARRGRTTIDFNNPSPTATAFSRRETGPTIINDALNDPAHQKLLERYASEETDEAKTMTRILQGIRAYANVRFQSTRLLPGTNRLMEGTISLLSEEPWLFKYPQRRILQTIASQVESLIEHLEQKSAEKMALQQEAHARREAELATERAEKAQKIAENAKKQLEFRLSVHPTFRTQDLPEFESTINTLLENFCLQVGATVGSIYLWDNDRRLFVLRGQYKWAKGDFVNRATYTEDSGWFGARALNDTPRHIPDLYAHYHGEDAHSEEHKSSIPGGRYAEYMFGAPLTPTSNVEVIGLPLSVGTKRLGVLALYRPIKKGDPSGFDPTVVELAKTDSSRLVLSDATARVSGLIDTLLQYQDDKVEKDEQKQLKVIGDQLSAQLEQESKTIFQGLICELVAKAYGAEAYLHEVRWNGSDQKVNVELVRCESADLDHDDDVPAEADRFLEAAAHSYIGQGGGTDVTADTIIVKRKMVDPEQRGNLDEAAIEGLVERAWLPLSLGPQYMWLLDLCWQTKDSRNYATEAHLRNKYLKDLSSDLSKFSHLWIQTRKRIKAERQARALEKKRQELLGRVGAIAQTGHEWKKKLRHLEKMAEKIKTVAIDAAVVEPTNRLLTELEAFVTRVAADLVLAEKGTLQAREIHLRDFIGDAQKDSIRDRLKKDPHISFQQDLRVTAAEQSMNITINNLINNAVKFARETPEPKVSIVATTDEETNRVHIRFTNNGKQIDPEICEAINNGDYDKIKGPRWGLIISACFAAYDNGSLRIEMPSNGDTVVILSLPGHKQGV